MEDRHFDGPNQMRLVGVEYRSEQGEPVFVITLIDLQSAKGQVLDLSFNHDEFDSQWHQLANADTVQRWESA